MVLGYCSLLIQFGIYGRNYFPYWHQILCDNSPLDIWEEVITHYLHKSQKQYPHFSSLGLSTPTIVYQQFICQVILNPWLNQVSLLHICECESNILNLLLRWFDYFSSSRMGPTMKIQGPGRLVLDENIQQYEMSSITVHH